MCMYICVYTSDITCLFTHVDTRTKTSVCVCERKYKYTNICKCMHIHIDVHIYIQIYTHIYTHICMHTYIYMYTCVYIRPIQTHTLSNTCDKITSLFTHKEIHKHMCINVKKSTKTYSHVNTYTRYSKCAEITCILANTYVYLEITCILTNTCVCLQRTCILTNTCVSYLHITAPK